MASVKTPSSSYLFSILMELVSKVVPPSPFLDCIYPIFLFVSLSRFLLAWGLFVSPYSISDPSAFRFLTHTSPTSCYHGWLFTLFLIPTRRWLFLCIFCRKLVYILSFLFSAVLQTH